MNCFVQLKGISLATLALATALSAAQTVAAQSRGQVAVMTSGNGVAVSGIWDANGFHGVYSGPTGAGRVVQPRKNPPSVKPGIAAGAMVGQGAMVVVGDPDDDESVSVSAGAFAGAGTGGAVAIAGPGGVAVGVPGAPVIIVGNGTYLWNDAKPPSNRGNHNPVPRRQEKSGPVILRSVKRLPQPEQAPPPPAPRTGSNQPDPPAE